MFIIGHRGARGEAPENTLSGFRYLRRLGILAVELDIQVSGDGELVVIHDYVLERTTSGQGSVHEKTVAELATLDACHNTFADWPEREGIPTLRQVMEVLHDFEHIQFEVKAKTEAHAQRVAALSRRCGASSVLAGAPLPRPSIRVTCKSWPNWRRRFRAACSLKKTSAAMPCNWPPRWAAARWGRTRKFAAGN